MGGKVLVSHLCQTVLLTVFDSIDVEEEGYPIPANNDHDPSNLRDLVTVLPKGRAMADLPPPSTALGSDITVTAVISYYCFACLPAGRTALTLPSAIWHINTKYVLT